MGSADAMTSDVHVALAELSNGALYRFADWPNPAVPNGRIGTYTVWRDDQLLYVGMAGRAIGTETGDTGEPTSGKLAGLISFAKSDRGCSRVWTAVRGPDHDQCL
jgi:hypothetical protein